LNQAYFQGKHGNSKLGHTDLRCESWKTW
jgi:hypothetical protein